MTFIAGILTTRAGAIGLAVLLVISLALGGVWWLRSDAASDAKNDIAVKAATTEQETRHEADSIARDAERSGPGSLLRSGRF